MRNKKINKIIFFILFFFIAVYLFTRLVNLDITLPFSFDEATDLVHMKQIYDERKITLIGPVSTDNKKVFSALTYYMYLPFAALGKFSIVSAAYGAVFWGLITALLLLVVIKNINPKMIIPTAVFLLVWNPLLVTQRHAYNPNLVFLWMAIAIWMSLKPHRWRLCLAGLAVALSVHQHYLSAIVGIVWLGLQSIVLIKNKMSFLSIYLWLGLGVGLAPFLLFDLTHLPGVFILRYLSHSYAPEVGFSLSQLLPSWWMGLRQAFLVIGGYPTLSIFVAGLTVILAIADIRSKQLKWTLLIPFVAQTGAGIVLTIDYAPRYIYPGLVFYLVWLFGARKKQFKLLQSSLITIILIGSLIKFPAAITQPTTYPPVRVVSEVLTDISSIAKQTQPRNPNIAAIDSPDGEQLSYKYRWLLTMNGVNLKAPSEYDQSETLFVVSTGSEQAVRNDASVPAVLFKNAKLVYAKNLSISPWKLYQFSFD